MSTPSPSLSPAPLTGIPLIDAMTTGYSWSLTADRTIDWSISGGFAGEYWISPANVQAHVQGALDTISYYANVKFNYVGSFSTPTVAAASGSEMNYFISGNTSLFPSTSMWARAFFPTVQSDATYYAGAAGDVVLNLNSAANTLPSYEPGSAGWFLILHETGHAIGLKHPHDNGGTGHPTFDGAGFGALNIDLATVMSYADDYDFNRVAYDPATPMILDVIALQKLYGANMSTNAGASHFDLQANNYYVTIWDASGHDEVSAAGSNRAWDIVLPTFDYGSQTVLTVGYAAPLSEMSLVAPLSFAWLMGNIEDALGSEFSDRITGSEIDNILVGLGGADLLSGGAGADTLVGGEGQDTLRGDDGADVIFGGADNDAIYGANGVDYLRGDDGNDSIDGGAGFDDINGNKGNDTCWGDEGNDWVVGGQDNDYLSGENGDDIVYGNLGNDICFGGNGNDWVRGGQGDDVIYGDAGNDFMSGDRGNDTIHGGAGADRFNIVVGCATDRVMDFKFSEGDYVTVEGNLPYTVTFVGVDALITIAPGDVMTLVGISSQTVYSSNDSLVGGSGDNSLVGGSGNDNLSGGAGNDVLWGGSGADVMTGGADNDMFIFSARDSGAFVANVVTPGTTDTITDFSGGTLAQGVTGGTGDVICWDAIGTAANYVEQTAANYAAAQSQAGALFGSNGALRYVVEQVGFDSYLFHGASTIDAVVFLQGVALSGIGQGNFATFIG